MNSLSALATATEPAEKKPAAAPVDSADNFARLLALAREGHGAAVIPTTAVRIEGRSLRLAPLMFRRKLLAAELAVLWNRERRLAMQKTVA